MYDGNFWPIKVVKMWLKQSTNFARKAPSKMFCQALKVPYWG